MCISLTAIGQKKALHETDFASWNRLENRQIRSDGLFVSYEINPLKGDGKLLVYNTKSQTTDTIIRATEAKFVPNTEAIVYRIKVPADTVRKHKIAKTKKELLPKDSVGLLHLVTKERIVFPLLKSFSVANESNSWVALLLENEIKTKREAKTDTTETKKPLKKLKLPTSEKNRVLSNLIVLQPFTTNELKFERVESYTMATKGNVIAIYSRANDSTRVNAVITHNTKLQKTDTLVLDSVFVKRLTLDATGKQIAWLQSTDTSKNKVFSLQYANLKGAKVETIADSQKLKHANKLAPSENGNLYFSEDAKKLFYGIASKPTNPGKDTIPDDEKPKLDVWSYTDTEIQPKQLKNVENEKKKTQLALYRIDDKRHVIVSDSTLSSVQLLNKNNAEIALGINKKPYERAEVWDIDVARDYYTVDLKTGKKQKILTAKHQVWMSPKTDYVVWFEKTDSTFYSLHPKSGKVTKITQAIPVQLTDELHDEPDDAKPYGIAGWFEHESSVLIYDRFDIWKVDLRAQAAPLNLTNGRSSHTRFRYLRTDPELVFIPANENIILSAFNERTRNEAVYEMRFDKPDLKRSLHSGAFMLSGVVKAKWNDAYIWSTQTTQQFPEISFSDHKFQNPTRISSTNPQQSQFNWLTSELVNWISFDGDSLQGMLFKPENFDPSKKYPMLVYFYDRSSEGLHRHMIPSPSRSVINIPYYCSNEYLVFVPDIIYKIGYPGQSAYNCIVSGVYSLLTRFNYIDKERMGLQGQSWGGYQTAYLITQTNLFKAAMAGAPVSNMISAYGGIRWGTGNSRMFQYEKTQSRIGGTLWEKPLLYIENSPLFLAPKIETPLLMMSNDNDGAVPWYQGIELFMALYRLNKPVWMLNYNGMEHNLEEKFWANRMDLSKRLSDFFDHYLKNKPAPSWMTRGVPAIEKGK